MDLSLDYWITAYLDFKLRRVMPRSHETYEYGLKRWSRWRVANSLNPSLGSIDYDEIQAYIASHDALSDYTRRATWILIRAFWRWLDYRRQLDDEQKRIFDKYDGIPAPTCQPRLRTHYTRADFDDLLAVCVDNRQRAILWTLWDTGMRAKELCGLRCEDLLERDRTGQIVGKGGKRRWVFWSVVGWEHLDIYRDGRDHGPLFLKGDGKAIDYNALSKLMVRIVQKAGVSSPQGGLIHGFRHAFAQGAVDAGIPDLELQQLMGHSSIISTQSYTRRNRNQLSQVHRRIR
jgi:integrase/recombinase XerD